MAPGGSVRKYRAQQPFYQSALWLLVLALPSSLCGASSGTDTDAPKTAPAVEAPAPDLLRPPPRNWVIDAANNEIKAIRHQDSYLRYLMHTSDHKGDRLRDIIETNQGPVGRLIRKDGRALTPDEDSAERERLQTLLDSPSALARHQKDEEEGKKLAIDLIQLLPDAMDFTYVPGQPQTPGAKDTQVVIDYTPKPGWNPPTTVSAGLRGLRGRAWIDARSHYVVRMEGEVFQGVNFAWGMLAHVYPGGKLSLEQSSVQPDRDPSRERWVLLHFQDDLRVRAVMVKTIAIQTNIESSKHQVLAGSPTPQDAIRTLLGTPLPK